MWSMQRNKYGPYLGEKKPQQSLEAVPEEALMSDLLDKDFKSVSLAMLKVLKETMSEELKESLKTKSPNMSINT